MTNYTEEQILERTKKILKDLHREYYNESKIESLYFNAKEELPNGENEGKEHPCWVIFVKALFDNNDFLTISDETGEPLYYQNFNLNTAEIAKDSEGVYYCK